MQAELIVDARNAVGESPVWVPEENSLYWVNIPSGGLQRWNASNGKIQGWEAPEMLACIARHQDGGWVAGMESGFFRLHPHDDGSLDSELCASVEHSRTDMRLNDGRCDRQGRFWAGSMVLNMGANADEGRMYRYEAGQRSPVEAQLSGFIVPNGLGFSPDGRTMYLSDSHPLIQQIIKELYDKNKGAGDRKHLSDVYYNTGLAMYSSMFEGARAAIKKEGWPLTPQKLKNGLESLNNYDANGLIAPVTVTAKDHGGGGKTRIEMWDGAKWVPQTDWFSAYDDVVWEVVRQQSAEFAKSTK